MIRSLWNIEFVTTSASHLLLDWGDLISGEISPKVAQQSDQIAPIGAAWSKSRAQGGAVTSLSWSTRRDHASHADLRGFCMRHAAAFPSGQAGTLRLSIQDGEVWEILDTTLATSEPMALVPSADFRTLTSYSATGGRMRPTSELTLYPGIPWSWINQEWDALTTDWDNL